MPPMLARPPYTKRKAPAPFFDTELGNIERAIPSSRVRTVFADDRPTTADFLVLYDATAGAITVTLPPADQVQGLQLVLQKSDNSGNAVTIVGNIAGASTTPLSTQWQSVYIVSTGVIYTLIAAT